MSKLHIPPQDMPPRGGFVFPKFRMPTLLKKGFTINQILFGLTFSFAVSLISYSSFKEKDNATALIYCNQMDAQIRLNTMLYGNPEDGCKDREYPQWNPLAGTWYYEPRTSLFATAVILDEAKQQVDQWRAATIDPDAHGYKICYGPSNYVSEHVCTSKCIHPDEIKKVKKDLKIAFPDQLSQNQV